MNLQLTGLQHFSARMMSCTVNLRRGVNVRHLETETSLARSIISASERTSAPGGRRKIAATEKTQQAKSAKNKPRAMHSFNNLAVGMAGCSLHYPTLAILATDTLDVIANCLSTRSLVAVASTCHGLRLGLAAQVVKVQSRHLAVAQLCKKIDRRLTSSRGLPIGEARRPLGTARTSDFLIPHDPQRPGQQLEWQAGALYLPWTAEGRSDGPRWACARLDATDIAVATEAFTRSPHLCRFCEAMDFSDNPFGDDGLKMLLPVFSRLPTLHTLELAGCRLTDSGAAALATALTASATHIDQNRRSLFRRLVLGSNPIGDRGCIAIAVALRALPSLRVLQLGDTEIGDAGAEALVEALDAGWVPLLCQIWLAATRIGPDGKLRLGFAEVRRHDQGRRLAGREGGSAELRICW